MKFKFNSDAIKKVFATGAILALGTYTGIEINKTIKKDNNSSNNAIYLTPDGFHIENIDNKFYAIRNEEKISYGIADYEKIYVAPKGYHIEIINNEVFAILNENTINYDESTTVSK